MPVPARKRTYDTEAVKHRFRRLLDESNAWERLRRILATTKKDDVFLKTVQLVMDRGFGKPSQELTHNIQGLRRMVLIMDGVDGTEKTPGPTP